MKDLKQLIALHVSEVKLALIKVYGDSHPLFNFHLLYVVFLIWRVHHCRHIVHVSLLCYASVYTQVSVAQGVQLERELQFSITSQVLQTSFITNFDYLTVLIDSL